MIRVTFKNKKQYEYIYCCFAPNQIGLTNIFNQTEYYPYGSIKKVEKKVKDLIVDEMIKLKATLGYDDHCKEWYVAVAVFRDGKLIDEDIYRLDDYIDITSLIKEQEE